MTPGVDRRAHDREEAGTRSVPDRIRRALANMIAALTVNAAIILAIPSSTGRNPAPIVLQLNRRLIDGCWAEGEFVGGAAPMVAVVALDDPLMALGSSRWISPN